MQDKIFKVKIFEKSSKSVKKISLEIFRLYDKHQQILLFQSYTQTLEHATSD